jgi:nicotinate phosphoribosyltransferase
MIKGKIDNHSLLTDFYELTMANGYLQNGMEDQIAYFDVFFRKIPDNGGFAIFAGLEQVIEYIENLEFTEEDAAFLRSKGFPENFVEKMMNFEFNCDIWAIPEGTPVFPGEPLMTIRGPVMQAQFLETMILLLINHQTLIATKSNRIVRAANGRPVMEFGTRRAHGIGAAELGARAAYIGGCAGSACTTADREMGVPAMGTMAHSWIQIFDDEYEAFKTYAKLYPDNATLLVDTYDTLRSGVPSAIKVFKELDPPAKAIRIDSGDISYLSKCARKMLDDAGLEDCKIVASNALDEYLIRDILLEGACLDSFGVGERLITAASEPVFGGVYKLAAIEKDGVVSPRMKISNNIEKITNPGLKVLYRIYDKDTDRAIADLITLKDEEAPSGDGYELFDQWNVWKKKRISNYYVKDLRERIYEGGKLVYDLPTLEEIRERCRTQVDALWEETKRFDNPEPYTVDLSHELWDLKQKLLHEHVDK